MRERTDAARVREIEKEVDRQVSRALELGDSIAQIRETAAELVDLRAERAQLQRGAAPEGGAMEPWTEDQERHVRAGAKKLVESPPADGHTWQWTNENMLGALATIDALRAQLQRGAAMWDQLVRIGMESAPAPVEPPPPVSDATLETLAARVHTAYLEMVTPTGVDLREARKGAR